MIKIQDMDATQNLVAARSIVEALTELDKHGADIDDAMRGAFLMVEISKAQSLIDINGVLNDIRNNLLLPR